MPAIEKHLADLEKDFDAFEEVLRSPHLSEA